MEEIRDEVLAGMAASGDIGAFEELVNRHRKAVYRLARSVTGNHHDADDAAQETFLRIFRSLGTYDPDRPFRPWLKRIAYNTSISTLKRSRSGSRGIAGGALTDIEDPSPGQSRQMEARQSASKVEQIMENMPGELRATLMLRVVEGLSYKEIAAATEAKIGTVMSRLSRARERVMEALDTGGRTIQRGEKR